MDKEWHFLTKNYLYVGPCLRSIQLFAVHLFYKIAQVHVDLLAFYPEMAIFSPKMVFWAKKIIFSCLLIYAPMLREYPVDWDIFIL